MMVVDRFAEAEHAVPLYWHVTGQPDDPSRKVGAYSQLGEFLQWFENEHTLLSLRPGYYDDFGRYLGVVAPWDTGLHATADCGEGCACQRCQARQSADSWKESDHPRGQPENKGEFAKAGTAGSQQEAAVASIPDRNGVVPEQVALKDTEAFCQNYLGLSLAQYSRQIPKALRVAVINYKLDQDGYLAMNEPLRQGKLPADKRLQKQIAALDSWFSSSASRLPVDTRVYRGLSPEAANQLSSKGHITDSGFSSTSLYSSEARAWAKRSRTVLEITAKKGTPALLTNACVLSPGDAPPDADEQELLLPRGSTFRVTGEREENGYHIISAVFDPNTKDSRRGQQRSLVVDVNYVDAWSEQQHPRGQPENKGEFAKKGSATQAMRQTEGEGKQRTASGGKPLPEHIAKLRIPPAWTDVRYNPDPNAKLLVTGRDVKGRTQCIYSAEFAKSQSAVKFARIKELADKFNALVAENDKYRKSPQPQQRDAADCLALIMHTGIRPGSEDDTGAKVKAYGATTLEGRHVAVDDGRVFLRFTGKKGVNLNLPVSDKDIGHMLVQRARKAGPAGQLFPNLNEKLLLSHVHSLDGGSFKSKDFRTYLATSNANDLVQQLPKPKDAKQYKKQVLQVAKAVSAKLGNTPAIALQSYISPVVFADWRLGAGVTADAWKESDHPRGQPENAGEFAKANNHEERLRQVPEHELGKSPLPNGMVRRFHYTSPEHLESIRKNGLLWRKSVSHKSGDPEALWSSPESDLSSYRSILQNRPVVEFADLPEHWQGNPFASQVDIPPRQILAIHEPWHEVYRYVKENPEARATLNRIAPGERADSTYRQAWERLRQEEGK